MRNYSGNKPLIIVLGLLVLLTTSLPGIQSKIKKLEKIKQKLSGIHQSKRPPAPSDWLAQHTEAGQTFFQYLACNPVIPKGKRKVLYIQPLGPFTKQRRKILSLSAQYMEHFFNLSVKILPDIPLSVIPKKARRINPTWGMEQLLSSYILMKVLLPKLPKDATASICFTASDLWPGRNWNFVFGQAMLYHRVGVWSMYRYGDPEKSSMGFKHCLRRTIKTATHETGHMFSIDHCIKYECNMNGINHLKESDRAPLALCPECLCKILWGTKAKASFRFRKLWQFCLTHGLDKEAAFFKKSLDTLKAPKKEKSKEVSEVKSEVKSEAKSEKKAKKD